LKPATTDRPEPKPAAREPAPRIDAVLIGAPLELKPSAEGGLPAKFSGTAYSGGFVPDYGVVIDMASTTYKSKMPLLDSHMRWEIIGVIEQATTEASYQMSVGGRLFSDMPGSTAERIAQLAQRGVPFEMSVGLYAYTREYVPAGKSIQVNGQTFNGPVNVLRNGQVREVSIVTLGADPRTESTFFDLPTGDDPMTTQTIEQLTAQSAQLTAQVAQLTAAAAQHATELAAARADGAKLERERIQAVEAALLPGHEKLIASLKFDGKTDGGTAALAVLAAEKTKLGAAAAALSADAPAPVKPAATPAVEQPAKTDLMADKSKPIDERCKATWEGSAEIRAEFGSLAAFTAFSRAQEAGQVRMLSKRAA
jgi:hypothetical protein